MGEAARRKKQLGQPAKVDALAELQSRVDLNRVSIAIRKMSESASSALGQDCYAHATLCQALLDCLGVQARLVIGSAGWRVGDGNGDVVVHAHQGTTVAQPNAIAYHAWLEVGPSNSRHRLIIDFTLYQLPVKAKQLDALDGGHTTVEWHPPYLAAPFHTASSLDAVTRGDKGLYFYEHNAELQTWLERTARPLDETDLAALQLIYSNPDVVVVGPNDTPQDA